MTVLTMANFHAYSLLDEKKIPWGKLKALSSNQSANNLICRKRNGLFLLAEYLCLIYAFFSEVGYFNGVITHIQHDPW